MHTQQLRPLQPAKTSPADDEPSPGDSISSSLSSSVLAAVSRARKAGQVPACETCRKRKKKCDRGRPECANCIERGLQCTYPCGPGPAASSHQLERLAYVDQEPGALPELLKTLPYHDALELLNLLREMPRDTQPRAPTKSATSSSSPTPLRPLSSPSTPFSPPSWSPSPSPRQHNIVGSLLPPASCEMEFELMVRHPIAYPVLLPVMAGSLPLEELLVPRRSEAFGKSLLNDTKIFRYQESSNVSMTESNAAPGGSYAGLSHLTESQIHLLDQINISLWTSLPISNQAAVEAIALYLNNDYPVLPLFDADLFLRDLVHNKPYFCSRLLVAALLAWACQAYTPMHPEAAHYSSAFFADARAQWSQYGDRESITLSSVSALQLLCMTAITHGKDDLALEYLRKGLQVAQSMGLVNLAPGTELVDAWFSDYADWRRAASYVAWGAFNWASVFSLHYHKSELEFPPRLSMPGDVEAAIAAEEGGQTPLPVSVEIFKASSKLWTIFIAVTKAYYGQDGHTWLGQSNALGFAEDIYRQLLAWADELPLSLVRCPGNSHAILMLQ
ncbi:hypothetical protein NW762_004626 [Fusarium torreyae]|uniref:Zn(2)-C6 fungal-type domain-containing protein n=1 Tax=Fusarium torreyae TaxID=1237075 RepID=A0A9W8VH40_9HYPO|nr:hypothetical protein NW762_004626 [Fusarium torreyae]